MAKILTFAWIPILIAIALFFMERKGMDTGRMPVVSVGERSFSVETADTPSARAQGLSGRDGLCAECAMLFRFDAPGVYGFWMPDMRFAIDIAWIRDGRVIHIERRVTPDFQGVLHPSSEATDVLETAAGALDGVGVGDEVRLPAAGRLEPEKESDSD